MLVKLAYSPCPNDTFMFHALASGRVTLADVELTVELADVETLNENAFLERFDITKLSFSAWLQLRDKYRLLNVGAALGFGCGPQLIAPQGFAADGLPGARVALPGKWTTAHLVFDLWAPAGADKLFVPYNAIADSVVSGQADCGVIIHESRFTYHRHGLQCVQDLGAWWEAETGLPLPLGCIAAHKRVPTEVARAFELALHDSIQAGRAHPAAALAYMKDHARELDDDVLWRHVETFVNDYSFDLGADGRNAVARLEKMAMGAGLVS